MSTEVRVARPTRWSRGAGQRRGLALALLAVPVLATAAVPLYSRVDPEMVGVPFFYVYQLAWVPLSILFMALALRISHDED